MKNKEKILFSVESKINFAEYKHMICCFPIIYWYPIFVTLLWIVTIVLIMEVIVNCSFLFAIVSNIVVIILYLLINFLRFDKSVKNSYVQFSHDENFIDLIQIDFYENYLVMHADDKTFWKKVYYKQFEKIIETNTHIYFYENFKIRNVEKKDCSSEMITFIRNSIKDRK